MSGFSFSKLKQAKPSMRRRLFLYMGALAALLLVTLFAVLLLLGQLKSPWEELAKSLTFRMEAFQSDMESLWRNVSVMGLHLSEDMTAILEKQTTDLSKLDGDADAVERLGGGYAGAAMPVCTSGGLLRRVRSAEHLSCQC